MRSTTRRMAVATLPVLLAGGAVAWAADSGPAVQELGAQIELSRATIHQRQCGDSDTSETRAIYYGTSTGSPGFDGAAEIHVHGFSSEETLAAWDEGTIRIRGEGGGWTSQGAFNDAAGAETGFKGLISGQTRVPGTSAGTRGRFNANFEVVDDPERGVAIRMGMDGTDSSLPAVQVTGRCHGTWRTVSVVLGPDEGAQSRTAAARVGWLR